MAFFLDFLDSLLTEIYVDLTKTANLNEETKKNTTHKNTIHVKNASMQTFLRLFAFWGTFQRSEMHVCGGVVDLPMLS